MVKVLNCLQVCRFSNYLNCQIKLTWRYKFFSWGKHCNSLLMLVSLLWLRSIHISCSHLLPGTSCCITSTKPPNSLNLLYLKNKDVVFCSVLCTAFEVTFSAFLFTNCLTISFFESSTSIVLTILSLASWLFSPIYFYELLGTKS